MLQSGLSRELFEMWCADKRNGLIMPGYAVRTHVTSLSHGSSLASGFNLSDTCRDSSHLPFGQVAGTLAHRLDSKPSDIVTSSGDRVPVNLSIDYISFSAHSDYAQTREFVQARRPRTPGHTPHGRTQEEVI